MTDDDELLAAELAFGLIEGTERTGAEARQASDAAFADAVVRWQAYGATMLGSRDEAPRPSLWPQIEARLPANDVAPRPADQSDARGWKYGTFAASAAAILLAFVTVERQPPATAPKVATAPSPPLVAILTGADSKAVLTVIFDPAQHRLTLMPAALEPGRHSAELWVIPADKKPRSLGLVDPSGNWRQASADNAAAITAGATLAVSMEPAGGSPTGQPTGLVVMSGTVHEI